MLLKDNPSNVETSLGITSKLQIFTIIVNYCYFPLNDIEQDLGPKAITGNSKINHYIFLKIQARVDLGNFHDCSYTEN